MTNKQKIESEVQQKLQKLKSEVRQKLNPYTPISEHDDLSGPLIREWLTVESQLKSGSHTNRVPPETGGDCGRARSAAG